MNDEFNSGSAPEPVPVVEKGRDEPRGQQPFGLHDADPDATYLQEQEQLEAEHDARVEGSRAEPCDRGWGCFLDCANYPDCRCGDWDRACRPERLKGAPAPAAGAAEPEPIVPVAETHSSEAAPWGVGCPLCGRRVVTTEAPCECGFRFPRGYGAKAEALANDPHEVEHALCVEVLALADDLDVADTEFCRECGVVLEACDEPPLCCQCAADEEPRSPRWSGLCPACKGYPGVEHRCDASCRLNQPEPRECMVTVYDWHGRYLGCMGVERWRWLLREDGHDGQ